MIGIASLLGGLGGLAGGAGSLFSGLFGGGGSNAMADAMEESAKMQYLSTQNALNYANQQMGEARNYLQPYYNFGTQGAREYMNYLGLGEDNFDASKALALTPGYDFMEKQGVSALDRSAAAGGLLGSGAHRQGLIDFGQNLGLTKAYEPYMNRLAGLTQMGASVGGQMGGIGTSSIPTMTNLLANQTSGYQTAATDTAYMNALANKNTWNQAMGGLGIMTGTLMQPQFQNSLNSLFGSNNKWSGAGATANTSWY